MILIKNRQRKIPINIELLQADAQKLLQFLGYAGFDLGILITTNAGIRTYNATYRMQDKPTDVLSFPFYPDLKPGEKIKATSDDDKNLGDIIISAEYVAKNKKGFEGAFDERMQMLLVHGVCHLLGYDHITDEQYAQMHRKETALLKKLRSV
jgi:probable rRNA maturation factor